MPPPPVPRSAAPVEYEIVRLTFDDGVTLGPAVSPDGTMKVVSDAQGMSWLALPGQRSTYLLAKNAVDEMKWSPDSKYFAIRLVDQVSIYKVNCP